MIGAAIQAARTAAHRASLGAAALLLSVTGVAFLTASLWLALVTVLSPALVAFIIGGAYLGVGLMLFGYLSSTGHAGTHPTSEPAHAATAASPSGTTNGTPVAPEVALVESFLVGLDAGRRVRQPH